MHTVYAHIHTYIHSILLPNPILLHCCKLNWNYFYVRFFLAVLYQFINTIYHIGLVSIILWKCLYFEPLSHVLRIEGLRSHFWTWMSPTGIRWQWNLFQNLVQSFPSCCLKGTKQICRVDKLSPIFHLDNTDKSILWINLF